MTDHRFGSFILASIAVNSILIALEDYKDPGRLNGNANLRNQIVSISYRTRSPSRRHVVANVFMAEKERDNVVSHRIV